MSSSAVATRSGCAPCRRASGAAPTPMRSSAAIVCGHIMPEPHSDALVLFGTTGDLARKMIFPALYAMATRGTLQVPVVGVAFPKWSLAQLRERVKDIIEQSGGVTNQPAFRHLLAALRYVGGDY